MATPAAAEVTIAAPEDCAPAIAADAAAAREAAAVWSRLGGGVPARLCEAAALEAMGATANAAVLLTRLAENPNRALGADLRTTIFGDAARAWLRVERPDLARAALASAATIAPPDAGRLLLTTRAAAAEADWAAARDALDTLLAANPAHALGHALRAAALRHLGEPQAALTEAEAALARDPTLPEALFEAGAAQAELGDRAAAAEFWLRLIDQDPTTDLARLAQRNLQVLAGSQAP